MRKFLRKFFWSHGAPLGYLGSLSQKGHPEIFSKWVLINLSNPLRHPAPLVDPLLTKNLDTAGPWCVHKLFELVAKPDLFFPVNFNSLATWQAVRALSPVIMTTWWEALRSSLMMPLESRFNGQEITTNPANCKE